MIDRILFESLKNLKKSVLLLGPRQTGKTSLIESLRPDLSVNFADEEIFLKHSQDFGLLRSLIEHKKAKSIFIDEVQRIPQILNTIQALIDEEPHRKFFLTGSSARRLKRGGANLLPGRIINYSLGTLILKELNYKVSENDLAYGFLPGVYTESDRVLKKDILTSYGANYVSEEIKAEALVKNLPSFSRFLDLSSTLVGNLIDYSKLAQRAKISRHQVPRYFEIFEDTMVGNRIFPAADLIERYDLVKHPKFYFFDVGVYNGLQRTFDISNQRRGVLCEHLVYQQLVHSASALRKDMSIHSLRTRGGTEIDFWIKIDSKNFGIEVKAGNQVIEDDVRHLVQFKKSESNADFFLFHFGKEEFKKKGIWCLPVGTGFKELGL